MRTKIFLICTLALSVQACAFTTQDQMAYQDLNRYRVDCGNRVVQVEFLRSQLLTPHQRIANNLYANTFPGVVLSLVDGSYIERQHTASGRREAVTRQAIHDMRYCQ